MEINARKYNLISKLMHIENEDYVEQIEYYFDKIINENNYREKNINEIFKPMRQNISISDIKTEQNYQGINLNSFNKLIEEINVKEPLTELLSID